MTDDPRILALEDRVAHLEAALGMTYAARPAWRLTPSQAAILGILRNADGVATTGRLLTALYADRRANEPQPEILKVFISKMRQKLRRFGVEIATAYGVGYYLTPEARKVLEQT